MTAFDHATSLTPRTAEAGGDTAEFGWTVPDGWQQGRGAWGGLVIGAIVRAVMATEPDPARTARSVSLQISAPALVGEHSVRVTPVRIGSGMSTWAAAVTDASGSRVAGGSVITGVARNASADWDEAEWSPLTPPAAPPAAEVPIMPTRPPFPTFTQHCEYRIARGLPLQGGPAETLGWIAYRDAPTWTDISLLALADAWYSVTLVPLSEMARIGTVNFTANLVIDPSSLMPGEPLLHHGIVSASRGGYASELRRLWTADGRLAVENLQTLVVG